MKRLFLLFLAALCLHNIQTKACLFDDSWYWRNSFLIVKPYSNCDDCFRGSTFGETVDFWYRQLGGKVTKQNIQSYFEGASYNSFDEDLRVNPFLLEVKKDAFALKYLKACLQLQSSTEESWDYERSEDGLHAAAQTLRTFTSVPSNFIYRVALLKMRVYAAQKDYRLVLQVWNTTAKNCTDESMKRRLMGYYAYALYSQKNYKEALRIYTAIGDERSMNMCISHFAGYANMKKLADEAQPGDETLYYAMQDFANNYCWGNEEEAYLSEDQLQERRDKRSEANRLKQLCREHINGKDKAMWLNFWAWLELCDSNNAQAMQIAEQAVAAKGTALQQENAQRILMLARVRQASVFTNENELRQMAEDYRSLLALAEKEIKTPTATKEAYYKGSYLGEETSYQNPNFCFMVDTYHNALQEYFTKQKLFQASICEMILTQQMRENFYKAQYEASQEGSLFTDCGGEWFSKLNNQASISELHAWMEALKNKKGSDAFTNSLIKRCDCSELQLNDLMGTKLMRNGKYSEALPYLKALTADYIRSVRYQNYLSVRRYNKARPFDRTQYQEVDDYQRSVDSRNYKAEFCQKMVDDILRVSSLSGDEKARLEMDMAGRLFQASSEGDLWAIGDFAWSAERSGEDLFCNQSRNMLRKALSDCTSGPTKLMIYYGLAAVPAGEDPFYTLDYDWDAKTYTYTFEMFHPAREAYDYLRIHRSESQLTSRCDVLKWYSRRNGF